MKNKIGIFDSGIGGFTVAKAISKILPNETLYYFGDTAHLPYGDKSDKILQDYSLRIADFLCSQNVKMIVIACNSASSTAYDLLKKTYGRSVLIIGMVDPVIKEIIKNNYCTIGIIGTKATIKSEVHKKKINKISSAIRVKNMATPLLAPMIEEGFYKNNISKTIITSYLSHNKLKNIQALVLACTHYPLIKDEISKFYSNKIDIIDPTNLVAEAVKTELQKNNLLEQKNKSPIHKFYISNWTNSFEISAKIFLGQEVKLIEKNIWKNKEF